MSHQTNFTDRRNKERHAVKSGALAFNAKKCGQIVNISLEGLSFQYIDTSKCGTSRQNGLRDASSETVDIMFGDYDFSLNDLPVKVVSDYQVTVQHPYRAETMKRRRCLKFGELTPEQIFRLKRFILINRYGMVPAGADNGEEGRFFPVNP